MLSVDCTVDADLDINGLALGLAGDVDFVLTLVLRKDKGKQMHYVAVWNLTMPMVPKLHHCRFRNCDPL